MGEGGGRRGGVIPCAWSAFDWASVNFVDVFFKYNEYGFSLSGVGPILSNGNIS